MPTCLAQKLFDLLISCLKVLPKGSKGELKSLYADAQFVRLNSSVEIVPVLQHQHSLSYEGFLQLLEGFLKTVIMHFNFNVLPFYCHKSWLIMFFLCHHIHHTSVLAMKVNMILTSLFVGLASFQSVTILHQYVMRSNSLQVLKDWFVEFIVPLSIF
jgi:hypothetical protein